MKDLQSKMQAFVDKPTNEKNYTIDGKQYRVISHYIGEKDLETTLLDLAKSNAYAMLRKSSA